MKLITYAVGDVGRLGLVRDDRVIDLADTSGGRLPTDMLSFLQRGEPAMQLARQLAEIRRRPDEAVDQENAPSS